MGKGVFLNVSAAGHVIPTLGLVVELVRRGEEIVYFEVPTFQLELEALGAAFRPYPPIQPYPGPGGDNQYFLAPVVTWCAKEWVPPLLEAVRAERPDYIVHDSLCLWGRIVAHVLGLPAVTSVATAAFCPESFHGCPRLRAIRRAKIAEAREGLRLFRDWRQELQTRYGVRPIALIDTFTNSQPLNVCYLPRELQPYAEKFGDEFLFVGPCDPLCARPVEFPFDQLDGRPLVLVSFGTLHNPGREFFEELLRVVRRKDLQVVLVLSPGIDMSALGEVPANVIVRPPGTVPQLELLERAALFITHGAGGGLREGVWCGVPLLAVPQTYEQELLSIQMAAQGAGIVLPPNKLNGGNLETAMHTLLSTPKYRENSARLGAACRAAGGSMRAADKILRVAQGL
jgi:MGT family glycosyltransferase